MRKVPCGRKCHCAGEAPPAVPIQATLQRELKPCPGAEAALPIRAVWHVPGSKASEQSSILILGGQGADEPDMLHVLPLEPSSDAEVHSCCAPPLHIPSSWSRSAEASRACLLHLHLRCCSLGLARHEQGQQMWHVCLGPGWTGPYPPWPSDALESIPFTASISCPR